VGFDVNVQPSTLGYRLTLTSVQSSQAGVDVTAISPWVKLKLNWAASVGRHLQVFLVEYQFSSADGESVVEIPFDYTNNVEWNTDTIDVAVSSLASGFRVDASNDHFYYQLLPAINPSGGYGNPGTQLYQVNKGTLYGPNRLFTNVGGQDVYKGWFKGYGSGFLQTTIVLHRAALPTEPDIGSGTVVVRNESPERLALSGPYSDTIRSISYLNAAQAIGKHIVRVNGFDKFDVVLNSGLASIFISTNEDGRVTINSKSGFVTSNFWEAYNACGVACPDGCDRCAPAPTCTVCNKNSYRVYEPVEDRCPCLSGFYEDPISGCMPCPITKLCKTCSYDPSVPGPIC
jgi:hypothetical protein